MSNSTREVTFTFLFPSWVEPFLGKSVHRLPDQDPGHTGVRSRRPGSRPRGRPGQEDGQREQRPQHQVSLSPCNFLSGHIAALVFVIRRSSKPFP